MALVCACTFDIGPMPLTTLLSDNRVAAILLESSMIISDNYSDQTRSISQTETNGTTEPDAILPLLLPRWRRISYEAESILRNEIASSNLGHTMTCIDLAILQIWNTYVPPTDSWVSVGGRHQHIMVARIQRSSNEQSRDLQYNLLTGSLLVDGTPLSRLPDTFQSHATYQRLFGNQVFKIVPSLMPGMRFETVHLHFGHQIYFGLIGDELIIRSQKKHANGLNDTACTYELIPLEMIEGDFPSRLITSYVHWIVESDGEVMSIEFRPMKKAWTTHAEAGTSKFDGLVLRFEAGSPLTLSNSKSWTFIDIRSDTFKAVSEIFRPLELPHFLQLTTRLSTLDIELPRFGMRFSLKRGDRVLDSKNHKGYTVDQSQSLGTLHGLNSKMVLISSDDQTRSGSRIVIVPYEKVYFVKEAAGHTSSWIKAGNVERIGSHFYYVDDVTGKLKDNGVLQSKLFLSYLHAITSHCVSDSLTGRTGTEEAIRILNSAATRSIHRLCRGDIEILQKISELSPRRSYHPEAMGRIQVVGWSELSGLAQDDAFYLAVQDILRIGHSCELFFPGDKQDIKLLLQSDEELLNRHMMRSSAFRISQPEYTTPVELDREYRGRVAVSESPTEHFAYSISKFLMDIKPNTLIAHMEPSVVQKIAQIFGCQTKDSPARVSHDVTDYTPSQSASRQGNDNLSAEFDLPWLDSPSESLRHTWLGLHKELIENDLTGENNGRKYKVMMLLAGMSYAQSADHSLIQVLLLLAVSPPCQFPGIDELELLDGAVLDDEHLKWLVKKHLLERAQNSGASVSKTLEKFVSEIKIQWPSTDLRAPSGSRYKKCINVEGFVDDAKKLFRSWSENDRYLTHLQNIVDGWVQYTVVSFPNAPSREIIFRDTNLTDQPREASYGLITTELIFSAPAPTLETFKIEDSFQNRLVRTRKDYQSQGSMQNLFACLENLSVFNEAYRIQ